MKHRGALFLVFFMLLSVSIFSQNEDGKRYQLSQWKYISGNLNDGAPVTISVTNWHEFSLPTSLSLEGGFAWIHTSFDFNSIPFRQPYYVVLGRIDAAYEVYLNGSFIASRGRIPAERVQFSLPGNQSACFLLPPGLIKTSGQNQLLIRLFSPAHAVPLFPVEITDIAGAQFENQVVSFLNGTLYTILAVLSGFIGLYFFALWIARKSDTPNLWYSIAAISIALYFAEIGADATLLPYILNRAFAKACLSISMAALVQFFISFLAVKVPRWFSWLLIVIPLGITITYVINSKDLAIIGDVFNSALLFVQFCIVFIAIVTIRAIVKGNREAIPLLLGVILGVGLGTHDVIYSVLGKKPLVWLQGLGFFCLNISLFISLTIRSSRLHADLERYSKEVHKKTEQLSNFLEQLEQTTHAIASLSSDIDEDAVQAARSAEAMAQGAEQIRHGADRQVQAVLDSRQAIQNFTTSLDNVNSGVQRQAEGIKYSAESVSVVADAVAEVAAHMEQTARSAEALQESADQGLKASREMNDSIDKIKTLSGTIVDIVKAVEDFAERTNLLAMNAAIEAAHSGAAGKGFAVIANEIKNLAGASAERAGRIRDSIKEITSRIESSVTANERMTKALEGVSESSHLTLDSIVSIRNSLSAQRSATEELRRNLADLSEAARSIREETGKQKEDERNIESQIDELLRISDSLKQAIDAIVRENSRIVQMIQQLAKASGKGKRAVSTMKDLLESRTA
ncbi:methyl-accepting chemotaxis protein [Gracilinema caldarium]|uniref:methyl-accepting chemotaxis protein n=1 Tax=Gracilinema caldarium TaxID=215591 RepID=UPI0026EFA40E|nr:methyl-accepting chemotaxis protein [Gracilinema caldarium]